MDENMNKFTGRKVPRYPEQEKKAMKKPNHDKDDVVVRELHVLDGTVFKGITEDSLIGDIKSSGERRTFETGAHRDSNTKVLKGRWDLIPSIALQRLAAFCSTLDYSAQELREQHDLWYWNQATESLYFWLEGYRDNNLEKAMWMTMQLMQREEDKAIWYPEIPKNYMKWMGEQPRWDRISPLFMKRVAIHYQKGGINYGDRNWEKGMPVIVTFDCAQRHLSNWLENDPDDKEDHLAAVGWNICSTIHTINMVGRGILPRILWDGDGTSDNPFVPNAYFSRAESAEKAKV